MRVRDEADVAARIAASMAGPCPTVACVVTAATSAAAIRYLAISSGHYCSVINLSLSRSQYVIADERTDQMALMQTILDMRLSTGTSENVSESEKSQNDAEYA